MLSNFFLPLVLMASFACEATAQTHLSYADPSGPFIDLASTFSIGNPGDTGGIIGYAERFDLPPGPNTLDSVDFVLDSVGADSNAIDLVPVIKTQTSTGYESLPDMSDPYAVTRFNDSAIIIIPGTRKSISCGKIGVPNTFFILIASSTGSNNYRASELASAPDLNTARAAFVAINSVGSLGTLQ